MDLAWLNLRLQFPVASHCTLGSVVLVRTQPGTHWVLKWSLLWAMRILPHSQSGLGVLSPLPYSTQVSATLAGSSFHLSAPTILFPSLSNSFCPFLLLIATFSNISSQALGIKFLEARDLVLYLHIMLTTEPDRSDFQ